ncbi:MAG: hypothetical protein N2Z74_06290, partial [Syntrophales bacterium]|nr:hypothetical protein [Syntrophales bacterium]
MLGDIPVLKIGEFTIRLMTKEDAPGVVALYRAIYGEHYPIKEMYDPEFIYNQQEKGLMVRAVAVDASGLVVGSQAIYRLEEAYPGLYESGHGMVLPPYRGHSFSNRFLELLFCQVGPAMGIEQFWGEAVTNHVFMQKAGLAMPGIS